MDILSGHLLWDRQTAAQCLSDPFCLICADSTNPLTYPDFWTQQIDSVICSPKYNQGIDYGETVRDDLPFETYAREFENVAQALSRLVRPSGSWWLNYGSPRHDPGRLFRLLESIGHIWTVQNLIVWIKSATTPSVGGEHSWGNFRPKNSKALLHDGWEYVVQLRHADAPPPPLNRLALGVPYVDESNLKRFGEAGRPNLRCRGNVWAIPYPVNLSRLHPAPFPPALPESCLRLQGLRGGIVLDPFCGICGTGIAAHRTGNRFIGIDLNPEYLRTGRRLYAAEVQKTQVLGSVP